MAVIRIFHILVRSEYLEEKVMIVFNSVTYLYLWELVSGEQRQEENHFSFTPAELTL